MNHLHEEIMFVDKVLDEWSIDLRRREQETRAYQTAGGGFGHTPIVAMYEEAINAAEKLRAQLMLRALREGLYVPKEQL